jgi:hypothetical protein
VRAALASLPWVDSETIKVDKDILQVRFRVTDNSKFDDAAIVDAITKKGYSGVKKLSGPST